MTLEPDPPVEPPDPPAAPTPVAIVPGSVSASTTASASSTTSATPPAHAWRRAWALVLPTCVVGALYFLTARPFFLFADAIGQPLPVYPAAGVACAGAYVFGWRAWPGVVLGWWAVVASGGAVRPLDTLALQAVAVLAQAALGGWAVRRALGRRSALERPRDVAVFLLLAGPVASAVGAYLSVRALSVDATFATMSPGAAFFTWWLGDSIGAVLTAPMLVGLFLRPRGSLRKRALAVVLPSLCALAYAIFALMLIAHWERQRLERKFQDDADVVERDLRASIGSTTAVLGVLSVVSSTLAEVPRADVEQALSLDFEQRASQALRLSPGVAAVGWAVPRAASGAGLAAAVPALRVERILPPALGPRWQGVDLLAMPAFRGVLLTPRLPGQPDGSAPVLLPVSATQVDQPLVLFAPPVVANDERAPFALIDPRVLAQEALRSSPGLRYCLSDTTEPAPVVMAGDACLVPPAQLMSAAPLRLGTRQWLLQVSSTPDYFARHRAASLVTLEALSLAGAAGFMALVLAWSARARLALDLASRRQRQLRDASVRHDATSRELADQEAQYRQLVELAGVGIAILDAAAVPEMANPAYAALLARVGASPAQPLPQALDARGQEAWMQAWAHTGAGAQRLSARMVPDGPPVSVSLARLAGDGAAGPRRLVVLVDETESHALAEAEAARAAAAQASAAKTRFVARMSHELRTPLNAIIGFGQLLHTGHPAQATQVVDWSRQIVHAGDHMLSLINDLLDLSAMENGQLQVRRDRVDLAAAVNDACALAGPLAQARGQALDVRVEAQDAAVAGDATRVRQVLLNVVGNAIKYGREGAVVRVCVVETGPLEPLVVSVADQGVGIEPAMMARLFKPYERLGWEHSGVQGTGLGLVICRELMRLMGGRLEVQSRVGEGTTVRLLLDRWQGNAAGTSTQAGRAPSKP